MGLKMHFWYKLATIGISVNGLKASDAVTFGLRHGTRGIFIHIKNKYAHPITFNALTIDVQVQRTSMNGNTRKPGVVSVNKNFKDDRNVTFIDRYTLMPSPTNENQSNYNNNTIQSTPHTRGRNIALRTLNLLSELIYGVVHKNTKPIIIVNYDRRKVGVGHNQVSFSARSDSNILDLWLNDFEGFEYLKSWRAKNGQDVAAAGHLEELIRTRDFSTICDYSPDWLGGSIPDNQNHHIRPIKTHECPNNHLHCQKNVKKAHFTKHLPLAIIHLHWNPQNVSDMARLIRDLHCHHSVFHIEFDKVVEVPSENLRGVRVNDPLENNNWYMGMIHVEEAWQSLAQLGPKSDDAPVMVIDSGVQMNHPDLIDNFLRIDGKLGMCVMDDCHDANDVVGHGTHCMGTITARTNNAIGISSITNNHVKAFACRFISKGSGQLSDAVKCMDFAISKGIKVINASWGGLDRLSIMTEALRRTTYADVAVIVAAGNSGNDLNDSNNEFWPACESMPGMVTVGATNSQNELAKFSNYGSKCVSIGAPGENIYSTDIGYKYSYKSGTSMAAPIATATAAMIRTANPYLNSYETIDVLKETVTEYDALKGRVAYGGQVNMDRAVKAALIAIRMTPTSNFMNLTSAFNNKVTITLPVNDTIVVPIFKRPSQNPGKGPQYVIKLTFAGVTGLGESINLPIQTNLSLN